MSGKKSTHVSEAKKKIVSELTELAKNKRTILIASIKDIPSSHYQEIVKRMRGKAIVKVPKKNLIFRALDESGNEAVKKLKEEIGESTAVLFSDQDCFELAAELLSKTSLAKAKAGQEAPEDIEVQAGPTDLVPGPAISELGAVGIPIQIEKGKINIKESKVIVKKGETISGPQADVMGKLGIKPFTIGFIPLAAFDTKESKIYLDIKINKEATLNDLKTAFGKALPFAVEIGYMSEDTIKFMIGKAGAEEKTLENLAPKEEVVNKETPNSDDKQQVSEIKPEETVNKEEQPAETEVSSDKQQVSKIEVKTGSEGGGGKEGEQEPQAQKQNQEENK